MAKNCFAFLAFALSAIALLGLPKRGFAAGNFGGYEQGLLMVMPPNKVRIYKLGSRTSYRHVTVPNSSIEIYDARWQPDNTLAVYLRDSRGRPMVYVYKSFVGYSIRH